MLIRDSFLRSFLKNFANIAIAALTAEVAPENLDVWFQDEARVGQRGTVTRLWAIKGTRPRAIRQQQFEYAYIFGAVFIVTILALVVFIPNPTPVQYHFFVIVMSLAAGGVATVMQGMINVQAKFGRKLIIGATGALGVFVIVYFFLPAMIQPK